MTGNPSGSRTRPCGLTRGGVNVVVPAVTEVLPDDEEVGAVEGHGRTLLEIGGRADTNARRVERLAGVRVDPRGVDVGRGTIGLQCSVAPGDQVTVLAEGTGGLPLQPATIPLTIGRDRQGVQRLDPACRFRRRCR